MEKKLTLARVAQWDKQRGVQCRDRWRRARTEKEGKKERKKRKEKNMWGREGVDRV